MGYRNENYSKVKREYEEKRSAAIELAKAHQREIHEQIPAIAAIDSSLAGTGLRIMSEISAGRDGLDERLAALRRENEVLQAERRRLLVSYGYPSDYTFPHYDCKKCEDSGFVGTRMCSCMRFRLTLEGLESAGLGKLFETQNFDTFSLKYYRNDPDTYRTMTTNLTICNEYAEHFDENTRENLFLCGKTGLGKTHLSTAMAGVIISNGYDVTYETAQNLFDDYAAERFGRASAGRNTDTSRYTDCDLLIIDDLGTESVNTMTVSCLYNLLNNRIISGRPMIINSNLSSEELQKRYGDRIFSRMLGEFTVLPFVGKDVRLQKKSSQEKNY